MLSTTLKPIICIVGPTSSGKTDLAQLVALRLDAEVVSADSMQIYKGMDIGTGKIPKHERLVRHHGFDLVSPGEPYSAALFQSYARTCFLDIEARGKRCVLAGGTGLYVRAAIDDYRFPAGEQLDNAVREKYTRYAEVHGNEALWSLLYERDPKSAQVLHPNNVKRVVRAFEMLEEGTTYSQQLEKLSRIPQVVPACFIGLSVDTEVLNSRINARVDSMVESGLVEEVQNLLNSGFREGLTSQQAIGYKEIVAALDGSISLDEAIDQIKLATRRYAKRQRTWYRKDSRTHWLEATNSSADTLLEECLNYINKNDASSFAG